LLRGLPYETIYPSYYNLRGDAINLDSLARWDSQKRRVAASVEFHFSSNPRSACGLSSTLVMKTGICQDFFWPRDPDYEPEPETIRWWRGTASDRSRAMGLNGRPRGDGSGISQRSRESTWRRHSLFHG